MKPSIIVWDLETVPDLGGFAAANDLVGKSDVDVRERGAAADHVEPWHRCRGDAARIAVPMIGGMVSSTLLTLIVIPSIYAVVKRMAIRSPRVAPTFQQT